MDPKVKLNVHLQVPPTTESGSQTPNTPEILNTIVNMTCGASPFAADFAAQNQIPHLSQPSATTSSLAAPTTVPPSSTLTSNLMTLDVSSPMDPTNQVSKFRKEMY